MHYSLRWGNVCLSRSDSECEDRQVGQETHYCSSKFSAFKTSHSIATKGRCHLSHECD